VLKKDFGIGHLLLSITDASTRNDNKLGVINNQFKVKGEN
jgi:hypothetical protein